MATMNWPPARQYTTAAATAIQVLPANLGRTYLAIFNEGAGATRIYFGSNDLVGIPLAAGGNAEFGPGAPGNAIWIKGAITTVTVIEGTGGVT